MAIFVMGVTMVGTFFCPDQNFFTLWERSTLHATISRVTGETGECLTFGLLYTIPITLLAAVIFGGSMRGMRFSGGVMSAGSVVLLLSPSTYLLAPFSEHRLFLAWAVGAFVGALCGVLGGMRLVELGRGWR
jgi:hypothetical protein